MERCIDRFSGSPLCLLTKGWGRALGPGRAGPEPAANFLPGNQAGPRSRWGLALPICPGTRWAWEVRAVLGVAPALRQDSEHCVPSHSGPWCLVLSLSLAACCSCVGTLPPVSSSSRRDLYALLVRAGLPYGLFHGNDEPFEGASQRGHQFPGLGRFLLGRPSHGGRPWGAGTWCSLCGAGCWHG